jgi:hypothetical protein
MALKDRVNKEAKPADITCEYYQSDKGGKRCAHYGPGGACTLTDLGQCVEWAKANPHKRVPGEVPFILTPPPVKAPAETPAKAPESLLARIEAIEEPDLPSDPPAEVPWIRRIGDREIAEFRALCISACIKSEAIGELWLVPEYTGNPDRTELRIDHAATLAGICAAFPGAKITSFVKAPAVDNIDLAAVPLEEDEGSTDL